MINIPYFRKISILLTVSLVVLALVGGTIVLVGVVSTTITPAEAAFAQRPGLESVGSTALCLRNCPPSPSCPPGYNPDSNYIPLECVSDDGKTTDPTCPAPYYWDPSINSCSATQDADGDGVPNSSDRCPNTANPRCFKEGTTR